MTGNDLLTTLQQQYADGYIDVSQLQNENYTTVFDQLGIQYRISINDPDGTGWTASPFDAEPVTISFSGNIAGDSTVLGVAAAAPLDIAFQSVPGDRATFNLGMQVHLPANWNFGQSFELLNNSIFRGIRLLDPASFDSFFDIQASADVANDPATYPPLHFTGHFDQSSSVFTVLTWFFSSGLNNPVTGPVQYTAADGAVVMNLWLAQSNNMQLLGSSGPVFDLTLSLYSGLNPALRMYESGVRMDTNVTLGNVHAGMSAMYLASSPDSVTFTVPAITVDLQDALDSINGLFGHSHSISNAVPQNLLPENLTVKGLAFQLSLSSFNVNYAWIGISAAENDPWEIWPGVLTLTGINLSFTLYNPLTAAYSYRFLLSAATVLGGEGGVPLAVSAELPGLTFTGGLNATSYNLLPLIEYIFGDGKGLPSDLEIIKLRFLADIHAGYYSFELAVGGRWDIAFGTENFLSFRQISASASYSVQDGASGMLNCKFFVKENQFDVELDLAADNVRLLGSWQNTDTPIDYEDIAIALGMYGLPELPDGIDLNLTSASFELETAGPSASFTLTSASYGSAALIAGKDGNGNWGFVFGMLAAAELNINLTDIDVVGNFVPSGMDTISVSNLRFIGATSAIPVYTPTIPLENVLGTQINSGLVLSIDLNIGTLFSETFSVRFGGLDDGTASDVPPPPTTPTESGEGNPSTQNNTNAQLDVTTPAVPAALPGPTSAWINVQRSFGPVHIARIGFRITEDNSLGILIDGNVNLAGLTIGLTGLEADVPVEAPFWPSFSLAGLEVGYISSGFTLAGALVKTYGVTPTQYTGELILQAGSFGATAFGSYTTVNNDPSLFAFLALNVPIGGPPFCVVTGLSFGFGYNRRLILPTIENVQTYPLVQAAMGVTDPQQTIAALDRYIVPQQNQYWLAAGIRFTSFEMLNAYALLTASFGTQIELALMGEALFTLPLAVPGEESLILAQADMVLLASINPSLGQLAVDAQLTSRSFVLDRNAQITGGFALYFWFGDNKHAGDFVVTLGGYNPYFNKPAYYPRVPLLGLNWQISSLISIKGGLYCALTPGVIMAGGNLSASFSSGNVKAWFNANADFLMRYKPFSFDATIAVSVGASYKLNLLFTTKTVSVTVGASLHLWGPPFAGKATVDLGVMSFDIAFGAAKRIVAPNIGWPEFRNSFLPPEPDVLPDLNQESYSYTQSLIRFSAAGGLLATLQPDQLGSDSYLLAEGETAWLVDPHHVRFIIDSPMPLNSFAFGGNYQPHSQWNELNGTLGIGPMGITPGNALITFTVHPYYNGAVDPYTKWYIRFLSADYPAGLWHNTTNTMSGDTLVKDVLSGIEIAPKSERPDVLAPLALSKLLFYAIPAPRTAVWSPVVPPSDDYFAQGMSAFQSQLNNQSAITTRADVLSVLAAQGLDVYQADEIEMAAYTANAPNLLYAAPRICYLGETSSTSVQTVSTWEY